MPFSQRKIHPRITLAIGLLLLGGATAVSAQGAMSAPASPGAQTARSADQAAPSAADKAFMQKAAVGGMAEVELGKLAQQKAASDQVKQFGSHMVDDHSKANEELKQIAGAKGVALPTALDAKHQKAMEKMQQLSGASFDRAYLAEMQKDHDADIALFQKQSRSGKDADVKAFAAKTLPTLRDHKKMLQETMTSMKTASR